MGAVGTKELERIVGGDGAGHAIPYFTIAPVRHPLRLHQLVPVPGKRIEVHGALAPETPTKQEPRCRREDTSAETE